MFLILVFSLIKKRMNIDSSPESIDLFIQRYGTVFTEFKSDGTSSWQYYPLFLVKRLSICILFFISSPILQLTISITFSLLVRNIQIIFYLLEVSPFLDKNMQISLIAGEICIVLVYSILLMPFVSEIEISTRKQGQICIIVMLGNIGLNILFSFISSAAAIYKWARSFRQKKSNEVIPAPSVLHTEADPVFVTSQKIAFTKNR